MNNKVEVSALILTIGEQEIKLTLPQARELLSALRNALEPAQKPVKRQAITDLDDLLDLKRVAWDNPKYYPANARGELVPHINARFVEEVDNEGRENFRKPNEVD